MISINVVIGKVRCLPNIFSLPGTTARSTRCGGEMTGNLGGPRDERSWHLWRKSKNINRGTVCTDIVLVSSELAAFCGDSLEILLGRSIGITDLEEKSLFADRLTMELLNNLITDFTVLESTEKIGWYPLLS